MSRDWSFCTEGSFLIAQALGLMNPDGVLEVSLGSEVSPVEDSSGPSGRGLDRNCPGSLTGASPDRGSHSNGGTPTRRDPVRLVGIQLMMRTGTWGFNWGPKWVLLNPRFRN